MYWDFFEQNYMFEVIGIAASILVSASLCMKNIFFSNVINRIATPGSVFIARGEVRDHSTYLKRMGFIETGKEGKTVLFRKAV